MGDQLGVVLWDERHALQPGHLPLQDAVDTWAFTHKLETWDKAADQLGQEAADWLEVSDWFRASGN